MMLHKLKNVAQEIYNETLVVNLGGFRKAVYKTNSRSLETFYTYGVVKRR